MGYSSNCFHFTGIKSHKKRRTKRRFKIEKIHENKYINNGAVQKNKKSAPLYYSGLARNDKKLENLIGKWKGQI